MAAEQILHVVLGGRQHHVDAGLIHQAIKAVVIEGDRESLGRLSVDVHDKPPWSADFNRSLAHDPKKVESVFGQGHAPAKSTRVPCSQAGAFTQRFSFAHITDGCTRR